MFSEYTCTFGESGRLSGIITLPRREDEPSACVVFINAGFIQSHGPFRLYALLARKLAANGVSSFRFDLGGIGFSEEIDSSKPLSERTNIDIKNAIDFVEKELNVKYMILCGLCSGAEDSFKYAEQDSRIDAVAMIDPHCYQTQGFQLRKIFSLDIPKRIIIKLERLFIKLLDSPKLGEQQPSDSRDLINFEYLKVDESEPILTSLLKRGVKLHYIYTGGMIRQFNHPKQFYEMFTSIEPNNLITVTHLPWLEHTQFLKEDLNTMVNELETRILSWLN